MSFRGLGFRCVSRCVCVWVVASTRHIAKGGRDAVDDDDEDDEGAVAHVLDGADGSDDGGGSSDAPRRG